MGLDEVSIEEAARALGCKPAAAASRLYYLGYGQKCGRCGGTGRYAVARRDDAVCYGCAGLRIVLPRLTRALLAETARRAAAGELEPYFEAQRRRREVRGLPVVIEKLLEASLVYNTCVAGAGRPFTNSELGRRFLTLCAVYQRALALAEGLDSGTVGLEEARREATELIERAEGCDMSDEEIRREGFRPALPTSRVRARRRELAE